jgi:hypothetical protein
MGRAAESIFELFIVLLLPGVISGFGMLGLITYARKPFLLDTSLPTFAWKDVDRWKRWVLLPLIIGALFLVGTWGYAVGQISLAKSRGIYLSPEEAVLARLTEGWGGATVIAIENLQVSPNDPDGSLPHVWFGGGDVYLDRIPEGGRRDHYAAGSFYVRIRDGWVYMPEGAFPTYVGWLMELYKLEGVGG